MCFSYSMMYALPQLKTLRIRYAMSLDHLSGLSEFGSSVLHLNWSLLIGPAVLGALLSSIFSTRSASRNIDRTFRYNRQLAEEKLNSDLILAKKKFRFDIETHNFKRRAELAEDVYADFLQISAIINMVRQPSGLMSEASGRQRGPNETEEQSRQIDPYYFPVARINREIEHITSWYSKKFTAQAVLGNDIGARFDQLEAQIRRVEVAAHILISAILRGGYAFERNESFRSQHESVIWRNYGDRDLIQEQVEQCLQAVEEICRPIIQLSGS